MTENKKLSLNVCKVMSYWTEKDKDKEKHLVQSAIACWASSDHTCTHSRISRWAILPC